MLHNGLHALNWGLQRVGLVLAVTVFAALLAVAIFVTILVAMQAFASFGQ